METPGSKIDIMPGRIPRSFCGRSNHGKHKKHRSQDDRGDPSGTLGLMRLMAWVLIPIAFTTAVRAAVIPPDTQALLTWNSLGSGTTYYVQASTDLSTWTTAAITTATNVSLSLNGNTMCAFSLCASNAPPQSATLAWNPSDPATNVAGYYICYGGTAGNYTNQMNVGLATTGVVSNLQAGMTYYFATTSYDSVGNQSGLSNRAAWQCPLLLNIQLLP
jgi:hypothetical protein